METRLRQFASDNYAGICPEALEAMQMANIGHQSSYGNDYYTAEACDVFRELFETDLEAFFVFNGTAANSLSLAALCQSYHSVICHNVAHIETDECGAPEFFSNGTKILLGEDEQGKINPESVTRIATRRHDIHYPKPRVLSLTQATEVGTVYSVSELNKLGKTARDLGLRTHLDGARFANAVVALDCKPADISWKTGIDVLCLGGTKNGIAIGEAVLFFNKELADEFEYRCKQAGQLCSKMRFLSAPWLGMIKSGAWLRNAKHANAMAQLLREKLSGIEEIELLFPTEANSVFVRIPGDTSVIERLNARGWHFYTFIGVEAARLMCSWDTTESDVEEFVTDLKDLLVK